MKFFIETYGCQMNVSDSELVTSILCNAGWEVATSIDEADLVLFNTCSVRQHAEDRVLGRIANEKRRKIEKPHLKIGLLGCMAQRVGEDLLQLNTGIDFAVGVDRYNELPQIINSDETSALLMDSTQIYPGISPLHHNTTCAFVTIMRGCDNFCSYCIVPHVRGRERSVDFEQVVNEVRYCGDIGLKDVTLLGQNVNSYQSGTQNFSDLLRELSGIDSIYRLRFITSHPKDLTDDLIDVMANSAKICKHIHLPMQSGDNTVLKSMNRKYSYEHYLEIVHKLRKAMPDIAITTDLIAGFPGETDAMFQSTLSAMQEIRFDYAFCFKYSERTGTEAASYSDKVPESTRLKRLQQMIDLQREITLDKFTAKVGSIVEVYVESLSRKSVKQVSGKTEDYKIAVLSGTESDIGKIKKAKVVSATAGTLICE